MKPLKILFSIVFLALFSAVTAGLIYEYLSNPKRSGTLRIKGLKNQVTVNFDQWGVPHIEAESQEDAYFSLGYLHGQDRLLQMDGIRRIAQGRLAEIAGPERLESDKFFRSLGIRRKAEQIVARMDHDKPAIKSMKAYLAGLNAYVEHGRLPIETMFSGGKPRSFDLVDMISASAYIAFTFDRGIKTDSLVFNLSKVLEEPYLKSLHLDKIPVFPFSRKSGYLESSQMKKVDEAIDSVGRFNGSNAWLISGDRTSSGKPILANDTHMRFSNPSIWYEAKLSAPGLELYAHFLPLISLPLLGHTPTHGWGVTIFHNDDTDIAIEQADPNKDHHVLRDGQSIPLITRQETIKVRGQEDVKLLSLESDIGPVFEDLIPGELVSVRWSFIHSDEHSFLGFYDLIDADSKEKAAAAVKRVEAPSLNILYGNIKGDIAWWTTGLIPKAETEIGFIGPSKASSYNITYHKMEDNPHKTNPSQGYLVSANEQPTEKALGYYSHPERARRLHQALSENKTWTVEDVKALQLDTKIAFHHSIIMKLSKTLHRKEGAVAASTEAFLALDQWKGEHDTGSVGPTIFYQFLYELMRASFQDEMGPELFSSFVNREIALKSMLNILNKPKSVWWDNVSTDYMESRDDILLSSWRNALDVLTQLYGVRPSDWQWGKHHTLTFKHPLGKFPGLSWLYDIGPAPAPGGMETVNQFSFKLRSGPLHAIHGPATRRVIDFGNLKESFSILPTGQSARVLDKHYRDQSSLFLTGVHRKVPFKIDGKGDGQSRLLLVPQAQQQSESH